MKTAIFEGPEHEKLTGWRHYLAAFFPEDEPMTLHAFASANKASSAAVLIRAHKVYPCGTWEAGPYPAGGWPEIAPAVLSEILGTEQGVLL